ncbi:hypothetical protein Tco_1168333 [Tanacetum coccineum]
MEWKLENGLVELVVDKDVYEMLISGNEAEVDVSEDEWLRESLKKLPIKSKKGQFDYFVDEENLIEDVDVDMAEFKRHTDPGVEWLGCKENVLEENEVFELEEVDHEEFDSGSDSDEGVRRKALRKVARMNKAIQAKGEVVVKAKVPDLLTTDKGRVMPFIG